MHIPLFHVDTFTDETFRGNPAAVCLLNSWLDDESLRKVAAENNLSATAFLVRGEGSHELRWFTPRCEVRLCGHATLALAHVLFTVIEPGLESVQFETRYSGTLTVRKNGDLLSLDFPALFPKSCENVPPRLALALGQPATPSEVLEVNDILIAVFKTSSAIRNLTPDFALLEELHPYAVSATAPGENADFVSRYFAPSYGVPEDPVTGSCHCALTPYWTKRLSKPHLHARQLSERGGELWCEMAGNRVIVTGRAILTLTGTLTV
jgi:PhzF family phenazine biosynthesis protein